jgi:hypothetical protein
MVSPLTYDRVLDALSSTTRWGGGDYVAALECALSNARPNFETFEYRESFRQRAVNRDWFASLLASNLYMEGYSAGRLKQYAGVISDSGFQRDLMRHARDEARHSREFFNLLFLVFPHLDTEGLRAEAESNVIDFDSVTPCPADYPAPSDEELLNSLILMNLFEIKALFLGSFIKPFVIAHAPREDAECAGGIVSGIVRDECYHIAYTAKHIDAFARRLGVRYVADTMASFVDLMNGSDDYHF